MLRPRGCHDWSLSLHLFSKSSSYRRITVTPLLGADFPRVVVRVQAPCARAHESSMSMLMELSWACIGSEGLMSMLMEAPWAHSNTLQQTLSPIVFLLIIYKKNLFYWIHSMPYFMPIRVLIPGSTYIRLSNRPAINLGRHFPVHMSRGGGGFSKLFWKTFSS